MIVIIADDFSGAAEIAGIGWSFGLKAEIQTEFESNTDADLVAVDTDSRSCSPSQAAGRVSSIARRLIRYRSKIDWIYKKTDSVLRGPVAAEILELLKELNCLGSLLIPVNPSKGRIIRQGRYLINGFPLNETDFSNDAEYPAISSDVLELLGVSSSEPVGLLTLGQDIPDKGIWIGQAESREDLSVWADQMDRRMLPAGAADFFTALLERRKPSLNPSVTYQMPMPPQSLFVFGSSSAYSGAILRQAERCGRTICRLPDNLFSSLASNQRMVQQWADEVLLALEYNECVIAAIDRPPVRDAALARALTRVLVSMIHRVILKKTALQLHIEGGATASAIVRQMGWTQFLTKDLLASGVVRIAPVGWDDGILTIKPGSYSWPDVILKILL